MRRGALSFEAGFEGVAKSFPASGIFRLFSPNDSIP